MSGLYWQVWACISRCGLVFASLGMYLQAWLVFVSLGLYLQVWACICKSGHVFVLLADICRSGLVFAGLGLYLQARFRWPGVSRHPFAAQPSAIAGKVGVFF